MQDVGAARADESGTEVSWVRAAWAEFFHRRGRASADGEGAGVEQRCDGGPASGVGIGTQ